MSKRLSFVTGLAALGLWAATMVPANAFIISRSGSFLYPCNGVNQTVAINFGTLPASSTQQIVGASLSLFANPGGVQFVTLSTNDGVFNVVLAQLGQNVNLTTTMFSGIARDFSAAPGNTESATVPVLTNAGGVAPFSVTGNCTGGAGTPAVQGTVVVWFVSAP
jgi:hypothetical protein